MNLDNLKFPIGHYTPNLTPDNATLQHWINEIEQFPQRLTDTVSSLSQNQKNWRYRPGGWTIKQVVHHCADSHLNSMIRFKLSLTEPEPIIRPYQEADWAELPDSQLDDLTDTLLLLKGLHAKWGYLLRQLTAEQLQRTYIHPEHQSQFNLAETIGNYAWHGNHHLAHIKQAIAAKGSYQ